MKIARRLLTLVSVILLIGSVWRLYGYPWWLSVKTRTLYEQETCQDGPSNAVQEPSIPSLAPESDSALQAESDPPPEAKPQVSGRLLLEIPRTGLRWVVGEVEEESGESCGIPKKTLDRHGVVLSPWYSYPGQTGVTVLAAHRYRLKAFAELDSLEPGDPIIIGLPDGGQVVYTVERLMIVPPDEIHVLDPVMPDRTELRIITCLRGSNAKRMVVYAAGTGFDI